MYIFENPIRTGLLTRHGQFGGDGLYNDNPATNPDAELIPIVHELGEHISNMAKGAGSDFGTGGMVTKIDAARIATDAGCDMIIANGHDFRIIHDIVNGEMVGTLFLEHKNEDFDLRSYIEEGKRH
mgnify:CR=1 FL=1